MTGDICTRSIPPLCHCAGCGEAFVGEPLTHNCPVCLTCGRRMIVQAAHPHPPPDWVGTSWYVCPRHGAVEWKYPMPHNAQEEP